MLRQRQKHMHTYMCTCSWVWKIGSDYRQCIMQPHPLSPLTESWLVANFHSRSLFPATSHAHPDQCSLMLSPGVGVGDRTKADKIKNPAILSPKTWLSMEFQSQKSARGPKLPVKFVLRESIAKSTLMSVWSTLIHQTRGGINRQG